MLMAHLQSHPELSKALNTQTSGEGSEWVPQAMSAQLIDDIRLQLKVAALFPNLTIPAGTGAWEVPVKGDRQTAYLIGESTGDSSSNIPAGTPPSKQVVFNAKEDWSAYAMVI